MSPKKKPPPPKPPKKGVNLAAVAGAPLVPKKIPPPPKCFTKEEIMRFKDIYTEFDEEKTGKIPLKFIPIMLRKAGFNPKPEEVEEMFKNILEDELVDTVELHEWYFMVEAKKDMGDDVEAVMVNAFEFLGHDNPEANDGRPPTGIVDMDVLKTELMEWGDPLTEAEFKDFPKVALKEKDFNRDTNELHYSTFVEHMNEKDVKFLQEPVNFFKLDQATLARLAKEKAENEKAEMLRKAQEAYERKVAKRQRMIDMGLIQADDAASVPVTFEVEIPPDPYWLLRNYR